MAAPTHGHHLRRTDSLDDIRGGCSKRQMLSMTRELLAGFSTKRFQEQLFALELRRSLKQFNKERASLALAVQRDVLPRYGFTASPDGVMQATQACALFRGDEQMDRIVDAMDIMLGVNTPKPWQPSKEEVMIVASELLSGFSAVEFQEKLTSILSTPHGSPARLSTEHMELAMSVQRDVLLKRGLPGTTSGVKSLRDAFARFRGDVDVDNAVAAIQTMLGVKEAEPQLSRQQAMSLLWELLMGFSTMSFQLQALAQAYHAAKDRMDLALSVQRKVLPKYGIPGNHRGVLAMSKALQPFRTDAEIDKLIAAIHRKLKPDSVMANSVIVNAVSMSLSM